MFPVAVCHHIFGGTRLDFFKCPAKSDHVAAVDDGHIVWRNSDINFARKPSKTPPHDLAPDPQRSRRAWTPLPVPY